MIGMLLAERYRIDAELGRGAMAVVYRGHDTLLKRDVAIKVISDTVALGTEGRSRLLHEAQSAAQLNHPNVVSIHDAGEADGFPFIVMELIEGASVHEQRPEALEDIIAIARQVCAALEYAHAHDVVHRDLKPENILLAPDGTAKLTDFGLARSVASRVTSEGTIMGTVFYLAPELALGQDFDGRADLYALGVMLYKLTTGRLPFDRRRRSTTGEARRLRSGPSPLCVAEARRGGRARCPPLVRPSDGKPAQHKAIMLSRAEGSRRPLRTKSVSEKSRGEA